MRIPARQLGVRFTNAANYGAPPVLVRAGARAQAKGSERLMGLRGLPGDFALLLAYVILSRSYIGDEAQLGIKIGPLPIFITDAVLAALIAISLRMHTGRLLNWGFSGGGVGAIGRAVWLLFLIALVYFALAFPQYRLNAVRDLAIFGYSLFFPLTYFALTQRSLAIKLIRYFIYATCLGAAFFNFQLVSGIHLFQLFQVAKGLPGHAEVPLISADNLGASLTAALAGLFAYLAVQRKRRGWHAAALVLCLVTLIQIMDRSAFLGFFLAAGVMFVLGVGRSRTYLTVLAAGFLMLLLLSAQPELPIPGGARLHGLWLALSSGADFQSDPDGQFRLERWRLAANTWITNPIFGVGFGAPILTDEGVRDEIKATAEQGKLGSFNQGMPHNSFLMVLARTGPLGLGLICFAWIAVIVRLLKGLRRRAIDPDRLAVLGILIAMIPYAALNLFFERPMLCAPFWIMLAAGYKLTKNVPLEIPRTRVAPLRARQFSDWQQPLNEVGRREPSQRMPQADRPWQR
jgi:O-antigen ligase